MEVMHIKFTPKLISIFWQPNIKTCISIRLVQSYILFVCSFFKKIMKVRNTNVLSFSEKTHQRQIIQLQKKKRFVIKNSI